MSTKIILLLSTAVFFGAFENQTAGAAEYEQIYIVAHAWHTGIVISAETWKAGGGHVHEKFPETQYLEFGWGDGKFYPSESFSLWLAIRAIVWPTKSVMHVAGLTRSPDVMFSEERVDKLTISRKNLQVLIDNLNEEFVFKNGQLQYKTRGLYHQGQFFEAQSRYHLFRTCNVWTASKLRESGVKTQPWRAITVKQLQRQLRKNI